MHDDIRNDALNTPLMPMDPLLEFGTHVRTLLEELLVTSKTELSTQLTQADLIGRLDSFGEIEERGGVEAVLGTVAGKAWPRSRVSKRKTVYTNLIEPLGLDFLQEVTQREEQGIRDFEVLYLAARMVKQSNGQMQAGEGLAMFYGLSRDQARDLMAKGQMEAAEEGSEDEDTWADFTVRLPATLVGRLASSLMDIRAAHGYTELQLWERLGLALEQLPKTEMGLLLESTESGRTEYLRLLTPDDTGIYVNSDGNPIHEVTPQLLMSPVENHLTPVEAPAQEGPPAAHALPDGTPPKPWPVGVQWDSARGKFMVRGPAPQRELIGRFDTFEAAVDAQQARRPSPKTEG